MSEESKVTRYDDEEITCPVCGSNDWKLFKYFFNDNKLGFRVACSNGCYVDNVNMIENGDDSFDIIKKAFELIEYDRESDVHKIITKSDILEIVNYLTEDEHRLKGLKKDNDITEYGRGRLDKITDVKEKLERLIV